MNPTLAQLHFLMEPIMPYIEDGVEELCVNQPYELFVRKHGCFVRHDLPELDYDWLLDTAILAGALGRKDVSERNPILFTDIFLPGLNLRLLAAMHPVMEEGLISFTMRKHGARVHTIEEVPNRYRTDRWNKWKHSQEQRDHSEMLGYYDSGDLCAFLRTAAQKKYNTLLCGPTGSGKSTMVMTMIDAISDKERLITVENTREVRLRQPNKVHLLYNQHGTGTDISVMDLLVAAMRMRPDRVLMQELLDGAAAITYVQSIVTGHPGSLTTIHGRTPAEAAKRLFGLVKDAGRQDKESIVSILASSIDIILPFENAGSDYDIGEVWFAPERARHEETFANLLEA